MAVTPHVHTVVRRALDGPTLALACYLSGRVWQLAVLGSPLSYSDTPTYRAPGQSWFDFSSVSFVGSSLRPWPVTLVYALTPSDRYRVLAQFSVGTLCWAFCIYQAGRAVDNRRLASLTSVLIAILALTLGVSGWDAVLSSESLSLSLVALYIGGILSMTRHGARWANLAVSLVAALLLALTRPAMIPLAVIVPIIPCWAWHKRAQGGQSSRRTTATAAIILLLAVASAGYAWVYNANIDQAWGHWLGLPGLNGRTITQYRVASETRLGPDFVEGMTDRGGPACLLKATSPDQDWLASHKESCSEGLSWLSENFVPSLTIHLVSNPRLAWQYAHDAFRDQSTLRPDGLPSLPSPVPRWLAALFFVPKEGIVDSDGRVRLTPSPDAPFPLGDPLMWWPVGGVFLLLLYGLRHRRPRSGNDRTVASPGRPVAPVKGGNRLPVMLVCLLAAGYVALFGTALLSATDLSRVGLPTTVLLRVAWVSACAVLLERLVQADQGAAMASAGGTYGADDGVGVTADADPRRLPTGTD